MTVSCGTARRVLWPDAGPRAASPDVVAAQNHLAHCPACQGFVDDMRRISAVVVSAAPRPVAPDSLRDRIFDQIERARSDTSGPRRRRQIGTMVAAAAAILAAAITAIAIRSGAPRSVSPKLVAVLANEHARALGETRIVSSDARSITRWLSGQVQFAVYVPDLPGAELRGARLVMADGRRGAVVTYAMEGEVLSYFIVPASARDAPAPEPPVFDHTSLYGYQAVSWREPGLLHAMVGKVAPSRLEQLARYCVAHMKVAATSRAPRRVHAASRGSFDT